MNEGIAVIDKPAGITSHDAVSIVRKKFNMRRVGHAGALDPLATGVLVMLIGKATKLSSQFMGLDKAYRSTLQLGLKTHTADIQGKILAEKPYHQITEQHLKDVFSRFVGDINQLPPMVSAVKYKGKKLYELARRGIEIERQARAVTISRLDIEQIDLPKVQFYLECSKGTYVRQLADDIGEVLGCGACITQIQRTAVGNLTLTEAIPLKDLNENHIRDFKSADCI